MEREPKGPLTWQEKKDLFWKLVNAQQNASFIELVSAPSDAVTRRITRETLVQQARLEEQLPKYFIDAAINIGRARAAVNLKSIDSLNNSND